MSEYTNAYEPAQYWGSLDIIGGAGTSPYNEPLTIDLTGTTSFTFRPQIDVALTAV